MHQFNRVLLVDDDRATNFLSELVFRDMDIAKEVQVAEDGVVACDLIKQNNCPDIIFLDIRMPRMDGFDFLENENPVGLNPLGGIELKIFAKDKEKAEKIIAE